MDPIREIDIPAQYHELLANNYFGLLSTIRHSDGLISTNPVGYVWEDGLIRISTLKSRVKYRNLQADTRVSFCVISPRDIMEYIEIRGHASLEDDQDRSFSRRQYRRAAGEDPPADLDAPGSERVIITVHPQQVSSPTLYGGRFNR